MCRRCQPRLRPGPGDRDAQLRKQLGISLPLYQSHGVASKSFIELAARCGRRRASAGSGAAGGRQAADSDPQKKVAVDYKTDLREGHRTAGLDLRRPCLRRPDDPRRCDQARQVHRSGKAIRDEIEKTKGFIGTAGIVNMSPTDHMGLDLMHSACSRSRAVTGRWLRQVSVRSRDQRLPSICDRG
jgi:branched-chain amino acid transport system substrate-binding protein